ncbi:hypothetical protein MtrunA17_Chr4g0059011 [Medicago truncatula]|uniref:Uncharacterized protein n=1 Tax=Medicago truncatula TaxID=3880 RepID=A0A396IFD2_MEDTR|nr:hypothetical protein MtrunA17_Chr4g0059011 [Medicago truncatula]
MIAPLTNLQTTLCFLSSELELFLLRQMHRTKTSLGLFLNNSEMTMSPFLNDFHRVY